MGHYFIRQLLLVTFWLLIQLSFVGKYNNEFHQPQCMHNIKLIKPGCAMNMSVRYDIC